MGEIVSEPGVSSGPRELEAVVDPVRIAALVQRIVSERLFVTVALPDGREHYNSTILGLEPSAGVFLLDELYPEEGNRVLGERGWLRVKASFDVSTATFTSRVVGEGEEVGIRYFRVALPERIDYAQRRARFRVPVDVLRDVPVMLETADGQSALGSLHDISAAGLSVRFKSDAAPRLSEQASVPYCVVRIPDEEPLVAGLEVRDIRQDGKGATVVGARFTDMDRLAEQRLERFVATAERELLKRRSTER